MMSKPARGGLGSNQYKTKGTGLTHASVNSPARSTVHAAVVAEYATAEAGGGNTKGMDTSTVTSYGAVDPVWYADKLDADRWMFHATHPSRVDDIRRHGLVPQEHGAGIASASVPARTDAVYLGERSITGWLREWTYGDDPDEQVLVAVDMRYIDATRLVPDEDTLNPEMGAYLNSEDFGVPAYDPARWATPGEWAVATRMGAQPGIVEAAWEDRQTVAVVGPIPPEALIVGVAEGALPPPRG